MKWFAYMVRIAVALALCCGTATPLVAAPQDQSTPEALTPVAVLVFSNLTGAAVDDWIGAGIVETVVTGLDGVGGLRLIRPDPSETVIRTAGDLGSPVAVAQALGARWVISGAYQRLEDQLRLTARVTEVATANVLQGVTVDGFMGDLFALQDQLVAEVRSVLESRRDQASAVASRQSETTRLPERQRSSTTSRTRESPPPEERVTDVAPLGAHVIDGPPPPEPPATINRDVNGRATVRAVRLTEPLQIDGVLDEVVYETVQAITDFIQQMPNEGDPATEKTDAWLMFDDTNVYVSARAWDTAPPSEWVMNEMRRDTSQLRDNDTFWVAFDTFHDRRNAAAFLTNPIGAIGDFAITNEGNPNSDWNPVWDVRTARFGGGWTLEMEIPFKSLRYRPGPLQVWGVQLRRNIRRKNERSYLTAVPISAGRGGIFRVSDFATMVGLEVPAGGRNLEIKPYGIAGLTTDLTGVPLTRNAGDGTAGLDVKYGITQNLTADLTYNTDFAQVEVDEQQVNLTRFSLFFPEKREFFLEGRGIFDFARGVTVSSRGSALRQLGGGSRTSFGSGNAPTLFYSRRIGLQNGAVVPILAGGRVTGKVGAFDIGALNIQTDREEISGAELTNFTVVRVKRDILRRSSVGALLTNRSISLEGNGSSQTMGADGTFSFYDNVSLIGYAAKTQTPGIRNRDTSYQGRFQYMGDRYGYEAEHLVVEDNFIPEVGFLRRDNFRRSYTAGRFSPRPQSIEAIRQFRLEAALDYTVTADTGIVETRQSQLGFSIEFEASDRVGVSVADNYEYLVRGFEPGPGVTLPVGGYGFRDIEATYTPGAQRRLTGTFIARVGEYFNGTIRSFGFKQTRLEVTQRLSIEPTLSINWIDTPQGAFRTDLAVSRVNYTFTPRMFFSGLVQYNSATDTVSNNFRFRWEYSPGSELFVVYTEDRETDPLRPDRLSELRNRGFVVKVNRLFRF